MIEEYMVDSLMKEADPFLLVVAGWSFSDEFLSVVFNRS
jgi:hypothetical protein